MYVLLAGTHTRIQQSLSSFRTGLRCGIGVIIDEMAWLDGRYEYLVECGLQHASWGCTTDKVPGKPLFRSYDDERGVVPRQLLQLGS